MMTDTFYQVQGAYGRKYKKLVDAQKDWDNGLDFCMMNGHTYVNKADHKNHGKGRTVKITLGNGLWGHLA